MRIKFILVIVSLFFASFVIISCLDSDGTIEYSSDDTIHAFELDTIYGKKYLFTIDQINGAIYNIDSVPFTADTIINKILITQLDVLGYVLTGDTALNISDSLDLSKTMEQPLKLKVVAPNNENIKDYTVEVRIHKQDPDSLVWTKMTSSFFTGGELGKQKSVILGESIFVYTSNTAEAHYTLLSNGREWTKVKINNLPANIKLSSILAFKDKLYVLTEDDKVYFSEDGISWSENSALSGNGVETFVASFPDAISGIKKDENGVLKFCTTNSDLSGWEIGREASETFLTENISSTVYKTKTGIWKAFMVGDVSNEVTIKPIYTTPWFSMDGRGWASAEAPIPAAGDTIIYDCPYIKHPSIIYYNDKFYLFGENFEYFYVSPEGLTWSRIENKVLFPPHFRNMSHYSMVVDKDNFIWILWGKEGEVWRGRINRLGFKIK
ncbi:hypothetical protein EZS27_027593 [termite gut metagenome]|uniref:Cadherin-like beta sandwich domain-containing protein n=1 Tax=termite gut metagenome TaxID=433724 RepID=A0A5J4QNL9_9ZZZZ